jgi:hydroxymethylglutaryl-CoA lyase
VSEQVVFTEVGPRDGFQNWPDPVSTEVKVELIRAAFYAGIGRVEATSMVSPKWVPQMADAEQVLAQLTPDEMSGVRVLVPNQRGYDRAVATGARNVLVNVGATDGFNMHNLNREVEDTLREIEAMMSARSDGSVRVDASISVAWGCPFDGPVDPATVIEIGRRLVGAGVAELSFGDTIGVATPNGVKGLASAALEEFMGVDVSMHFHDTRGMGLANALAALDVGVRMFEGSIGGIGGCPFAPNSTGNVCTEDLVEMINDLGYETEIDVEKLISAAKRMSIALDAALPGKLHRAGRAPWLQPKPDEAGVA